MTDANTKLPDLAREEAEKIGMVSIFGVPLDEMSHQDLLSAALFIAAELQSTRDIAIRDLRMTQAFAAARASNARMEMR